MSAYFSLQEGKERPPPEDSVADTRTTGEEEGEIGTFGPFSILLLLPLVLLDATKMSVVAPFLIRFVATTNLEQNGGVGRAECGCPAATLRVLRAPWKTTRPQKRGEAVVLITAAEMRSK